MTQRSNSPLSQERKAVGLGRDLHRIQEGSKSSLAELRLFIKQLQGRKPSEVLGLVTGSPLIRATAEATLYLGIVLVVLTVVPFMMAGDTAKSGPKAGTQAAAASEVAAPAADAVTENTAASTESDGAISAENAQKAVNVMGLGETKTADPDKNPLDNLDNLLDDVK